MCIHSPGIFEILEETRFEMQACSCLLLLLLLLPSSAGEEKLQLDSKQKKRLVV